jgi:hypothetical protein
MHRSKKWTRKRGDYKKKRSLKRKATTTTATAARESQNDPPSKKRNRRDIATRHADRGSENFFFKTPTLNRLVGRIFLGSIIIFFYFNLLSLMKLFRPFRNCSVCRIKGILARAKKFRSLVDDDGREGAAHKKLGGLPPANDGPQDGAAVAARASLVEK